MKILCIIMLIFLASCSLKPTTPKFFPCTLQGTGSGSIVVEDHNKGTSDLWYIYVVVSDGNSTDAIPLPLVSEELIKKIKEDCITNR